MNQETFARLAERLAADELTALVSVVGGPGLGTQRLVMPGTDSRGTLGSPTLDRQADLVATEAFRSFSSSRHTVASPDPGGADSDLFCEVHPPASKLVLVGAVHVAIHLARFAKELGFRTVVIDPRTAFATSERFSHVDELVARWPREDLANRKLDEGTYLATLAHDPKIDLPALEAALRSPVRYIGALGSKRTHAKRIEALRERGFDDEEIRRIYAPIGLDLGGRRAEEIALSIMAQIVAVAHGK